MGMASISVIFMVGSPGKATYIGNVADETWLVWIAGESAA
jgi:hypothetical protein